MTAVLALLLVLVVCSFVVLPLLRSDVSAAPAEDSRGGELWKREKAVAVLAIVEADFDRATGKLSEDDYRVLRSDYEGRALHAMDELRRRDEPAGVAARFCAACGRGFAPVDQFCAGCGATRVR